MATPRTCLGSEETIAFGADNVYLWRGNETTTAMRADHWPLQDSDTGGAPTWSPLAEALGWASRLIAVNEVLQNALELAWSNISRWSSTTRRTVQATLGFE